MKRRIEVPLVRERLEGYKIARVKLPDIEDRKKQVDAYEVTIFGGVFRKGGLPINVFIGETCASGVLVSADGKVLTAQFRREPEEGSILRVVHGMRELVADEPFRRPGKKDRSGGAPKPRRNRKRRVTKSMKK